MAGCLARGVALSDLGVVLGAAAIVEQRIDDGALALLPVLALELVPLLRRRSGPVRPDMNLRIAVDPRPLSVR